MFQLLLNPDKTKLVNLSTCQTPMVNDFCLSLLEGGTGTCYSGVVWCDLGVILDANLTFNEHIVSTVSSSMS